MRIVVDAMGTDERPTPDVMGGIMAAREYGDTIILVGDEPAIRAIMNQQDVRGLSLEVIHTPEQILMDDKPSEALKQKPNSSMHIGTKLVADGQADAFVSMGNTGAAYAISMLSTLKRIPGVKRPALTAVFPIWGQNKIFVDVGANADSRAEWVEQFALMGSIYAETALGMSNPRIATLSNGEEEGKGNQLTREVQENIRNLAINYIGHVEPKEVLEGRCDVIVMDGFVGNVFMKTFEASIIYFTEVLREELTSSLISKVGAALSRDAFARVRTRLDTGEVGGAPLLGVNGVVIIGHGGSQAYGVKNAIKQARLAVQGKTIERLQRELANRA